MKQHRKFSRIIMPAFLTLTGLLLAACGQNNQGELASRAAKLYYEQLLAGQYADFVDGTYHKESITPNYREQLIDNAKMFIGQQQTEHNGIREVRIANFKVDSLSCQCDVYLVFAYGDSTCEEVLVPMISEDGVWLMK